MNLRNIRLEKGLSVAELSRLSGVPVRTSRAKGIIKSTRRAKSFTISFISSFMLALSGDWCYILDKVQGLSPPSLI